MMKFLRNLRRCAWVEKSLLADSLVILFLALLLAFLFRAALPEFGLARYVSGELSGTSPLPVQVLSPESTDLTVTMDVVIPVLAPRWYTIQARDCIRSLFIDGQDVSHRLPFCSLPGESQRITLAGLLPAGKHVIQAEVRSGVHDIVSFDISPSLLDPIIVLIWVALLVGMATLVHLIVRARMAALGQKAHPWSLPTLRSLLSFFRQPVTVAWTLSVLFLFVYIYIQPRIITGYYINPGEGLERFQGSFSAPKESEDWYPLFFAVRYRSIYPPTLRVLGDDCVEKLVINGLKMPGLQAEACGYDIGALIHVKGYVHPGINTMQAVVHNAGGAGSFHIEVDQSDPLLTFLLFFASLTGGVALWLTIRRYPIGTDRALAAIIFLGIVLRVFYFFATPFHVRANDVDGHIEYAHFLVDHGRLPGMRDTWESFQPPLYYIMNAGIVLIARFFDIEGYEEVRVMQAASPILTIIGFLLCVGIIRRLVDPAKYRYEFLLAVAMLSVLPGAIYNAGRVNNDVLVQFFLIIGLYQLVRAFDPGTKPLRHWLWACLALALGICTKTNALILAPVIVLSASFVVSGVWWKRLLASTLATFFVAGCYLGMYAIREPEKHDVAVTNIVTNSVALNGDLIISNEPRYFYQFSPLQVLKHPFNDGWNDAKRRQFFLEFLYKSAFFGEWGFPAPYLLVGRWLLLVGMLCFPLALAGVIVSLKRKNPTAVLLLGYGISVLLLHAVFRYKYPFSPSQDFRYISSIAVVAAAFSGAGITALPRALRSYGFGILTLFALSGLAFMIRLP